MRSSFERALKPLSGSSIARSSRLPESLMRNSVLSATFGTGLSLVTLVYMNYHVTIRKGYRRRSR